MEYDPARLKARLVPLPPVALTAIASATAERVYPVYQRFWVGDFVAEVRDAIDLGWTVCAGLNPQSGQHQRLAVAIEDHVDYLNEEDITILAQAAAASLRILETLDPAVDIARQGAHRALSGSIYVAQLAAKVSKAISKEAATDEELRWQELALTFAAQGQGPWTPEAFRSLAPHPPAWWDAYERSPNHLI